MPGSFWFWNRIARRYARLRVPDQASYERKLAATRQRLTPGSKVLEFGCGTGTTAIHHAPVVAWVDAVDAAPAMLEIARARAAEAGVSNVAFHNATVEDFSAAPGSYDMVMMHSLLHLLDDPAGAIAKAADLLKPGGWLVSSTTLIAEDGLNTIRLAMLPASLLGLLPKFNALTGEALLDMHRAAGLEIDEHWKPGPKKAMFIVARKP